MYVLHGGSIDWFVGTPHMPDVIMQMHLSCVNHSSVSSARIAEEKDTNDMN